MKKPTGFIIGHGRSLIDGAPIVVIATVKSRNTKTGDMVQTWILRQDIAPMTALMSGEDYSICGDCQHRPSLGGACYVDVSRAPSQVFKAFLRGAYPDISNNPAAVRAIGRNRKVRIGAYGDPMAVPASVFETLCADAAGRTGYSHQWHNESIDPDQRTRIMRLCMASVDNEAEFAQARALGYRTFRVRKPNQDTLPGEVICPASDEGGNKTECIRCCGCSGNERPRAATFVIIVHGSKIKRFISKGK